MDMGTYDRLKKMNKDQLAEFQSAQAAGSATYLLAEKEWERRNQLDNRRLQVASMAFSLLGVLLGAMLTVVAQVLTK